MIYKYKCNIPLYYDAKPSAILTEKDFRIKGYKLYNIKPTWT